MLRASQESRPRTEHAQAALIADLGATDPAEMPDLLRTWSSLARYDKKACDALALLRDDSLLPPSQEAVLTVYVAECLATNGRRPEAIALLEQLLSSKDRLDLATDDQAFELLVSCYGGEGQWDAALATCRRYVDEAPHHPWRHLLLAKTCLRGGQPQNAEAAYRRALELRLDNLTRGQTECDLGTLLVSQGRPGEGAEHLREAQRLGRGVGWALIEALIAAGQADQARAEADAALARAAMQGYSDGRGRHTRGELYHPLVAVDGEPAVLTRFQAAHNAFPNAGGVAGMLIDWYAAAGQFQPMVALLRTLPSSQVWPQKALSDVVSVLAKAHEHELLVTATLEFLSARYLEPAALDAVCQVMIGSARDAGKLDELRTRVEAALAQQPDNDALVCLLAQVCMATDRRAEAVRLYAPLAAECPGDQVIVGWLLAAAGDDPAHSAALLPVLERSAHDLNSADARAALAKALANCGREQEAVEQYALIFESTVNPFRQSWLADEVALHQRLGIIDQLVDRYRRFVPDWPNDPAAQIALGDLYLQLGRRTEAIARYQRASRLSGKRATVHRVLAANYVSLGMPESAHAELWAIVTGAPNPYERVEAVREYVRGCRKLEVLDRALAQVRPLIGKSQDEYETRDLLEEYIDLCRELKRYREALAIIDEWARKAPPESRIAPALASWRKYTVEAMDPDASRQ